MGGGRPATGRGQDGLARAQQSFSWTLLPCLRMCESVAPLSSRMTAASCLRMRELASPPPLCRLVVRKGRHYAPP